MGGQESFKVEERGRREGQNWRAIWRFYASFEDEGRSHKPTIAGGFDNIE